MPLPSTGHTELIILKTLAGTRELYGLELVERVRRQTDGKVALSIGGLYTTLHRMEHKRLITGRWGETTSERQGARRRYYKLTGMGERVLADRTHILTAVFGLRPQEA